LVALAKRIEVDPDFYSAEKISMLIDNIVLHKIQPALNARIATLCHRFEAKD